MKINIGDKVKFLNDVGGGIVTKIIDENNVFVETDDGFEFPFPTKELVKIIDETKDNFLENKNKQKQSTKNIEEEINDTTEIIIKDNEEENIYIAFLPEDSSETKKYSLNLINDSNWQLIYSLFYGKKHHYTSKPGHLQSNYIEKIKTFSIQELSETQEIIIQIIFYRSIPYDIKEPINKKINIKAEHFINKTNFVKNEFFDQNAYMLPIIENNPLANAVQNLKNKDLEKIAFDKEIKNKKSNEAKKYTKTQKQNLIEVDLHINALLDDTTGMEAKDMLDYQMNVFQTELKRAQKIQHIKKIVFIHGKGNGRLRNDIRAYLDRNNIKYQDASFQKYGFGATLVFV
jgi:hypothetical protein